MSLARERSSLPRSKPPIIYSTKKPTSLVSCTVLLPRPATHAAAAAFPDNVNAFLLRVRPEIDYSKALQLLDPMAFANGKGREAVLSPLGMVHVYRAVFLRVRDVPRRTGRAHLVESRARPRSSSRSAPVACFKRTNLRRVHRTHRAQRGHDDQSGRARDGHQRRKPEEHEIRLFTHRWSNHLDRPRRSQRLLSVSRRHRNARGKRITKRCVSRAAKLSSEIRSNLQVQLSHRHRNDGHAQQTLCHPESRRTLW